MYLTDLVLEVRRNPEVSIHTAAGDEFLGWPLLVELEEEGADSDIVGIAASVIRALWASGHNAVAACDFEGDLPWKGGIARLRKGE
jgi:hypothetical protein